VSDMQVTEGTGPTVAPDFAQVHVEKLRVRNFRGMTGGALDLNPVLTILVGRNNVGKSRLLRALAVGLGATSPERDDLTVGQDEPAEIDIVLAPTGSGEFERRVGTRLGRDVQSISEEPPVERFAWRTSIMRSQEGLGVRSDMTLLLFNVTTQDWEAVPNAQRPTSQQRSIVVADLVQPRRDLDEELRRRGSPVRRVLDDLELSPDLRDGIEDRLRVLGAEIVGSSPALEALRSALGRLDSSVSGIGSPVLEPLPVRLEELSRTVAISLDTGSGGLPLRFHGSGVRSLASIQVQSVLYDRRIGRDGPALLPHPVSLVEEPEAHLHPQAQMELSELLGSVRGQVVVSTHSSHLVAEADPSALRLVQSRNSAITVVDLSPTDDQDPDRARRPRLHKQEMERLRRLVERPFGELMFASAVVIGDGATERALLPPVIRHALGTRAQGVCVVDPGSLNGDSASTIIKFAELIGIPWFLFSDSDDDGRKAVQKIMDAFGDRGADRVVWVPGPPADGQVGAGTEKMLINFDEMLCRRACVSIGYDPNASVMKFMTKNKGVVGRLLATELTNVDDWDGDDDSGNPRWPAPLKEIVKKLDAALPPRPVADDD
jgi:putative ATP-dependent endonuclease of the OLD family